MARPLYSKEKIPDVWMPEQDIFALDSTTISCSIKLMSWALGKYERGAVKMHTLLDLRGHIPSFIHITHGKWHDSNVLDILEITPFAIYVMDKAYVGFKALHRIHTNNAYFITRAKKNMKYEIVETNYNIYEATGLRGDFIRKRALIETANDELKNIAQIEHSRHRSFNNFIANALSAIAAYCFFEKKPAIDVEFVNDGQLSLF